MQRQVEVGRLGEFPFQTDSFEEHDELELEKDDRVERGAAAFSVALLDPLPNKADIQFRLTVAVEVVLGNEFVQ